MSEETGPILIVEDIPYMLEMLAATLRYKGYQVSTAHNGQEALDVLRSQTPSLILTDILMPKMDGFKLAHKVRNDPRTKNIPVMFLSATYVSAKDKEFALCLGGVKFLEKPVDGEELHLSVAEALSDEPEKEVRTLSNLEFYHGYRARLQDKLEHKTTQIRRARRLVETVSAGQRPMFESLLVQAEVQKSEIETELKLLADLLQEQGET